jgi:hypothetical protein
MNVAKAYLAGTGATSALVGAALLAFLTLGALFALNGLPEGLGTSEADSMQIVPATHAPEATAAAVGSAPRAVTARPDGIGAAGDGPGAAAAAAAGLTDAGVPAAGAPGTGVAGGGEVSSGVDAAVPAAPAPGTPSAPVPAAPAPGTPSAPDTSPVTSPVTGPVQDGVEGVDQTVEQGTGVDLPLSETTDDLTGKVDDTVGGLTGGP